MPHRAEQNLGTRMGRTYVGSMSSGARVARLARGFRVSTVGGAIVMISLLMGESRGAMRE